MASTEAPQDRDEALVYLGSRTEMDRSSLYPCTPCSIDPATSTVQCDCSGKSVWGTNEFGELFVHKSTVVTGAVPVDLVVVDV